MQIEVSTNATTKVDTYTKRKSIVPKILLYLLSNTLSLNLDVVVDAQLHPKFPQSYQSQCSQGKQALLMRR